MFRWTAARPDLRQNQSGQATIEAILLGFISFMLVMGLVYQFNAGFRDYVDNYFGNYLVCLLETGELPSLGSGRQSVCTEALATFELGEEGPGLSGSEGGSGASGDPSDSQNRSAEGGSGGLGAGNISYVNSRRGGSAFGGEENAPGASAQKENPSARGSGGEGDGSAGGAAGYTIVEVRGSSRSSPESITLRKVGSSVEAQQERTGSSKKNLVAKENENALAATKLSFDPNSLKRSPAAEESDVEWGFGDYLRYLIIFAIIIAVIVLVGGQALQISKSREI